MSKIKKIFKYEPKIIKTLKEYDEKEKAKQQKSKVLGQKPVKGTTNKKERINVHNSSRM